MSDHSEAFMAFDTSKLRNTVRSRTAVGGTSLGSSAGTTTRRRQQQAGAEAGRQVPAGDILLRGRADRLWAVPADQEPWAGVHCGRPFAHSEEAGRSGEE